MTTHDTLRAAQIRSVGTAFLQRRPMYVAPGIALAFLLLARSGAPVVQLVAVGLVSLLVVAAFVGEALYTRRHPVTEPGLYRSLALTAFAIATNCFCTGRLRSPFLALLFAPLVTGFAAFGRTRRSTVLLALHTALLAALALAPALRHLPAVRAPFDLPMTIGAAAITALLLQASVAGLTEAHTATGAVLERMRTAVLDESAGRLRALEAVGAKVAHEVKNPLASIKGLVQLLARGPHAPREEARFRVLLSESDRIEAVLADYLTFARPMEDLRIAPVTAREVLTEVVSVLEGRALAAGVALDAVADASVLLADGRRLRGRDDARAAGRSPERSGRVAPRTGRGVRARAAPRGTRRDRWESIGSRAATRDHPHHAARQDEAVRAAVDRERIAVRDAVPLRSVQ